MKGMGKPEEELLKKLESDKLVQLVPQGISMMPFISGGRDRVLVGRKEHVGVGDIVLAPHGGHLILHRVYAVEGSRLTLMGDGNLKGVERVERSEVMGVVLKIVKPDGRCRKPHKAWLWRHLLPVRRYLLKIDRKLNKLRTSSRVPLPEVPRQ